MSRPTAFSFVFFYAAFFIFSASTSLQAQENPLAIFDPLIGKTWVAEGQWGDGSVFRQELRLEYDLNQTMVRTHADGFVDEAKTKWGKRNHGIRQWDAQSSSIQFWEFDVFGGVTKGKIFGKDENIYYQYDYDTGAGISQLTDAWERISERRYRFKVGIYQDDNWKQVFLETEFVALPAYSGSTEHFRQILQNIKAFSQTVVAGQASTLAQFYTADGKIFPGNQNIISGRSDIAQYWQPQNGYRITDHQVTPEVIDIHDDWASDYGYYEGISTNAEGEAFPFRGKYVILWKKVDGQWLIDLDIWNKVP